MQRLQLENQFDRAAGKEFGTHIWHLNEIFVGRLYNEYIYE